MKKRFVYLLFLLQLLCSPAIMAQRLNVIFETDMGNDIDDALAIDMLYKYHRTKKIKLMGVMLNKQGFYPPRFVDLLNRWYDCKQIPIGACHIKGDRPQEPAINYTEFVCQMKDEKGRPLYRQVPDSVTQWQDAVMLYRELLAKAEDSSVTIISVGFSTNLAALLASPADGFSPLTGSELVAKKVERLVTMAGHIENPEYAEFNVVNDVASCQKVFDEWPTPIYMSPFELGENILYPGSSIRNDFSWTKHHPVCDAYHHYLPKLNDRPTWDLTAVLFAVDPGELFNLSQAGRIKVTDKGCTHYIPDATGSHYFLTSDVSQRELIRNYFVHFITQKP